MNLKFNTVNNKERSLCCRLVVSVVAQAWSALLPSSPCVQQSVSWWPLSSFRLWIILLPPSLPLFIFPLMNQCDSCLVPLARGFMAGRRRFISHGSTNSVQGLGLPKVEVHAHPRYPPPLSNAVVKHCLNNIPPDP